ncbi:MAG: hypothetical protein WCG92_12890 [Hyphomicrobiales bacterium]
MNETPTPPNLDGLVELANRDGVDVRPTLLRVMTDLYVQKQTHTEQEERHFTELMLRLIDLVDVDTLTIIAEKIAGYPTAPVAIRHRLLKEVISIAPAASSGGTPPIDSGKLPTDDLSELFFASNPEERRLILLNLPYASIAPAATISPAAALESTHRLEAAALGHNSEVFAREIERILRISRAHARRVYEDTSGEPIVVAAVALGMPSTVLQRILLCLNPAISHSVQRVHELALLHGEVEPAAALRLLAIWQMTHPLPAKLSAPAHQPQHRDEPARERRSGLPVSRPKVPWDEFVQSCDVKTA